MDTTLNDVLAWWGLRPAGDALVIFMVFASALYAVGSLIVYRIRYKERKRIASLMANPARFEIELKRALAEMSQSLR